VARFGTSRPPSAPSDVRGHNFQLSTFNFQPSTRSLRMVFPSTVTCGGSQPPPIHLAIALIRNLYSREGGTPIGASADMHDSASHDDDEQRLPLDALVSRIEDPRFASRHRRQLTLRETSAHANPVMLAVASPDSLYVRCWRDHARTCEACTKIFEYFGLPLEH